MLFHSPYFLFLFLPLAAAGYLLARRIGTTAGKVWLIGVSMAFYATWRWTYLPLMMTSIAVNYATAVALHRVSGSQARKGLIWWGVLFNIGLLGYFKYRNFFLENLRVLTGWSFDLGDFALPLAISFYTFTQIGYLVDIYRKPRIHRGFLDYCLFIFFFPHLVAGPILRHWEFFPQLHKGLPPVLTRHLFPGLVLLILGIGKKVIFAEISAAIANPVFNAPVGGEIFFECWVATLGFAMQVYFDFSAYSDMALGLGLLFGIRLPVNFLSPYKATSILDFWNQWHITLGRFLRDYVYVPIGRFLRDTIYPRLRLDRRGVSLVMLNVIATMLVSGIWHGAGWTFVVFGLAQGCGLAVNHWARRVIGPPAPPNPLRTSVKWAAMFGFNLLTFVYFRSPNLDKANHMLATMLGFGGLSIPDYHKGTYGGLVGGFVNFVPSALPEIGRFAMLWLVFLLVWTLLLPNTFELLRLWRPAVGKISSTSRLTFRPTWWFALFLGTVAFWIFKSFFVAKPTDFIYFQF